MADETLRRGERTRGEILAAAYSLFIQQGYHGTSMRQIAQKSGTALGGLYNHFESKEQVFQEVFWEFHPYHKVFPLIQAAQDKPIEEFAQGIFAQVVATLQEQPDFMNLMLIEVVEFNSIHARQLFSMLQPKIVAAIQALSQNNQGSIRPLPPLILIRFFFGLIFGYWLTEVIFSPSAPAEFRQDAPQYIIDLFLHGLMYPAVPPAGS